MKVAIKVYGERNSGTNYLEQLLANNLDVQILKFQPKWHHILLLKLIRYDFIEDLVFFLQRKQMLGWKHGCPRVEEIKQYQASPLVLITITKNPYAYLLSLHRNPYHFKGEKENKFVDFLKQKWFLRRRDFCGSGYLKSAIELWNVKNRSYLDLKKQVSNKVLNLSYEALLENPEPVIQSVAQKLNIGLKNEGEFQNVEFSTKDSERTFNEYRNYYLNLEYCKELTGKSIECINQSLDMSVVSFFDYKVLSPQKKHH
jgi:hypothetical protein